MAQVGKGFTKNVPVADKFPSHPDPNMRESASVAHNVPRVDTRSGLDKAMASATHVPPEGLNGHAATDRVLDQASDQNGSRNESSGDPPSRAS